MPNRLTDVTLDEGSLVDAGAHQDARVVIFKRDVSKGNPLPSDLHEEAPLGTRFARKKKRAGNLSSEQEDGPTINNEAVEGEDPMPTDTNNEPLVDEDEEQEIPAEVAKYISEMEAYTAHLEGEVAKHADADEDNDENYDEDEVLKSLDPAVQELVSKADFRAREAEERLAEVEKALAEQNDIRLTEHYTGIVKNFRSLPVEDVSSLAKALKVIATVAPDEYEVVKSTLDRSDSLINEGSVFAEFGKGFDGGIDDAGGRIDSLAKEKVEKGLAPDLATARTMVFDDNPSLYDEMQGGR